MNQLIECDKPIITFINVPPKGDDVYSKVKMPVTGIAILHRVMRNLGYDVETIDPRFNPNGQFTDSNLERLGQSHLIGATFMSRNRQVTHELLRQLKESNPKLITVAGGFDATFKPETSLKDESGIDYVVRKEGPAAIAELTQALKNGQGIENILGLSHKIDGEIRHNPDRPLMTEAELALVPTPYFPKKILDKCTTHAIVGSHGCFGRCKICSVVAFHEGKYRREIDNKIIEQIKNAPPGKKIFFVDDNFAPYSKIGDVKRLMRRIIDEGLNDRDYFVQLDTVTVTKDPEFVKLLVKMGVKGVFLGIESMDPKVLKGMKKPANDVQNEEAIKIFRKHGIYIHAMLVAGSENDTYESIETTIKELIRLKVNSIQVFAATPIPGSEFGENELILPIADKDTNLIDGQHVLFIPSGELTCAGLQDKIGDEIHRFYDKRNFFNALPPREILFSDPKRAFKLAGLTSLVRAGAIPLMSSIFDGEYMKRHKQYLREVDKRVYSLGRTEIKRTGVIFEAAKT